MPETDPEPATTSGESSLDECEIGTVTNVHIGTEQDSIGAHSRASISMGKEDVPLEMSDSSTSSTSGSSSKDNQAAEK